MERLLLHPPVADPTQPYLSLPTLKGYLRQRGLDARVIDLNIEATDWLFQPETLELVGRRIGSQFVDLNRKGWLSFEEQLQYRRLVDARPQIERMIGAQPPVAEVFRQREHFYDGERYTLARRITDGFFEALSAAYWPWRFGFNHVGHTVVPWSFDMLDEYSQGESSPLRAFYEHYFAGPANWDWDSGTQPPVDLDEVDFVGISIVFPSQIPEALHLARFLRERAPHAFLALGGPGIHQVVVHLEPELQRRVLEYCDAIGLYEGEETLTQLFPKLEAWRAERNAQRRADLLRDVPNLFFLDPVTNEPCMGPRWTLDLREGSALPDYGDLDLDRYLAPSRTLLYAPTRGCYWGKCSFCYYGLTETATASYREIPPEQAASELGQLARRHGVKNFYLSCDVLSPVYAVRLAEALIDKGIKIRWSSDLKIEKYFTPERCALLAKSGLRSAAFGIESGSDRILELMRKGSDRATMTAVNRAFHEAGVATEWMTFTDHPDESVEEALDTIQWIEEQRDYIDCFIVGKFGLERGSHIAQDPQRYGVKRIYYAEGDELRLYALFSHVGGRRGPETEEKIETELNRVASAWALSPYPWAGANSTHHTFLHLIEFGQSAFKTHFQRAGAAWKGALPEPPVAHIAGLREKKRFDPERMLEAERAFFERYLRESMYTTVPAARMGGSGDEVAPLSMDTWKTAMQDMPDMRGGVSGLR